MNNVYFACRTCKSFIDAGYRWCYWTLENPGYVTEGQRVLVECVFAAQEYWEGTEDEQPLPPDIQEQIRMFLLRHQAHDLIYGDQETFIDYDNHTFLYWLNADEKDSVDVSPRTFIERLHLTTWAEVTAYIAALELPPWWWGVPEIDQQAQQAFAQMLEQQRNAVD